MGFRFDCDADLIRQVHVDATDGIHDGFEGMHVDSQVMIRLGAKVQIQGAGQQAGAFARTIIIAKSLVAVQVRLVQLSLELIS